MVLCKKCGNDNPLGRVFCTKCGTKLELTHMSADHVQEEVKHWSDPIRKYWKYPAGLVVVLILAMVGLALYPQSAKVGRRGTRVDGREMEGWMNTMKAMKPGAAYTFEFREENINGYFEFFKTNAMATAQFQRLSVQVTNGTCKVRVIRPLGSGAYSIPLVGQTVSPTLSYDLYLQAVGKTLRPYKVQMGHLTVNGPMRSSALMKILGFINAQPESAGLANITNIKLGPGKITVVARK